MMDEPGTVNPKKIVFSLVTKPPQKLAKILSGTERTDPPSEPRNVNFLPRTATLTASGTATGNAPWPQ